MSTPVRRIPLKEGQPDEISTLPALILHVIEIDGIPFQEGEVVAVIPHSRLEERVLLGCESPTQVPIFSPDIDFLEVLQRHSTVEIGRIVSRQHVILSLRDGTPAVSHLAQRDDTTWLMRATRLIPVRRENLSLQSRDVLILGNPSGRCVRIKIEFVGA